MEYVEGFLACVGYTLGAVVIVAMFSAALR